VGDSKPPESAPVNLVNSYARRRGGLVEVVLADPQPPLDAEGAVMVLRRGGRDAERVRATASLVDDARGRRLVAAFPSDAVGDGQWRVVVRAGGRRTAPGVRLLVQGRRPTVLLWGDRPTRAQVEV
jgi:hypothetical protein